MNRSWLVAGALMASTIAASGCVQTADSSNLDTASDSTQSTQSIGSTTTSSTTLSPTPPSTTVIAPAVAAAQAKQSFLDAANAICAEMNAQILGALGPSTTLVDPGASYEEIADLFDFSLRVTSNAIAELRALPQPPGDEQRLATLYDDADALVETARELEQAVRNLDLDVVQAVEARLEREQAHVNSAFNAYGLIECGRS